jgi:hypothetical protein
VVTGLTFTRLPAIAPIVAKLALKRGSCRRGAQERLNQIERAFAHLVVLADNQEFLARCGAVASLSKVGHGSFKGFPVWPQEETASIRGIEAGANTDSPTARKSK